MLDKQHIKKEHLLDSESKRDSLLAYLSTHYPEALSEGRLNLEALSRLLGLEISERGYELNFTGKPLATALYGRKSTKELKLESHFNPASCHSEAQAEESTKTTESKLDCHALPNDKAQNDKEADSSKQAGEASQSNSKDKGARRQDFGDKNGALRAEAREHTQAYVTEAEAKQSPFLAQKPTPQDSTPYPHTIIKGDNLDALKLLKSAYTEKIKMIYIDPPYNTHNENFIYNDSKREDFTQILREVGLLFTNEEGLEVESESLQFFRNITGSRSHSGWLAFMLPRLKLARELLRDDGVIFISIDDNEQANLKLLCDEIFGEENFVSCFVWQKKSGGGQAKFFYEGHEYVLIYTKDKNNFEGLFKSKQKSGVIDDFLRKVHGKYTNNLKLKNIYEKYPNEVLQHRNLMFEELDIFLQEKMINQAKYDEIKQNLDNGTYFLKPYNDKFNLICRFDDKNQSLMYSIISGHWTSDGNNENETMFGANIFKDPKPTNFVKCLIESITTQKNTKDFATTAGGGGGNSPHSLESHPVIASDSEAIHNTESKIDCHDSASAESRNDNGADSESEPNKSLKDECPDIILDFFAGSGTTAHAVMQLNAEDGGKRKYILVQLDEAIDPSKAKTAYDFCKNELGSEKPVISDITIERVKRASSRILESHKGAPLELGFRVFSMVEKPSLISDELGSLALRWRSELSPRDKARNLSLFDNKMLHVELQEIIKDSLYQCEQSFYIVALNDEVLARLRESESEEVYISGYDIASLQSYKNLESLLTSRLKVVY